MLDILIIAAIVGFTFFAAWVMIKEYRNNPNRAGFRTITVNDSADKAYSLVIQIPKDRPKQGKIIIDLETGKISGEGIR